MGRTYSPAILPFGFLSGCTLKASKEFTVIFNARESKGQMHVLLYWLCSMGVTWLSSGITSKRMNVWACKRSSLNLDILSFNMACGSLNLGNHKSSNQREKGKGLCGWNCWRLIVVSFRLLVINSSFIYMFKCFFWISTSCKAYKISCTFQIRGDEFWMKEKLSLLCSYYVVNSPLASITLAE